MRKIMALSLLLCFNLLSAEEYHADENAASSGTSNGAYYAGPDGASAGTPNGTFFAGSSKDGKFKGASSATNNGAYYAGSDGAHSTDEKKKKR